MKKGGGGGRERMIFISSQLVTATMKETFNEAGLMPWLK